MRNIQTSVRENWVAERLAPFFRECGFTWLPHLHQFRKSTERGFTCLAIAVSDCEGGSLLEAHLGIRIDAVENLTFPFTNGLPGFQPDSMTLVTPLARLKGKPYERIELSDENSADEAAAAIRQQFEEKGLAFLSHYSSLENMDNLFNRTPEEPLPLVYSQSNRCFRAVAMARLLSRKDFELLVENYSLRLAHELFVPLPTLDKFSRLVEFLRHYSQN
ncbi:MAG: hypothetical protein KDD06_28190 [Phaeodactylibacter sp.]|nr:hypothetical protein [Phaeodactylibacter sp.]MCB9287593.1 hypothetical protein [Lewinellaceae bacterium]